jgi:hypothetical protein
VKADAAFAASANLAVEGAAEVCGRFSFEEGDMPRGDKSKYTPKQKRQARHIEESFEKRGVPPKEAAGRAWAVENKISGGGRLGGSGEGRSENKAVYKKGGKRGGRSAAARPARARSASATKAARTRARRAK